ncbi:MAG: hypothetical protein IIA36_11425, partial [Proteobacteria bacterium]|nr:hypothetical protein [Pseudomonadota bacterium]
MSAQSYRLVKVLLIVFLSTWVILTMAVFYFQIITALKDVADAGIAGHWLYKTDQGDHQTSRHRARRWVKDLLDLQQRAGNPLEFVESLKIDLFPDEVYIFTPRGNILELPRGAC